MHWNLSISLIKVVVFGVCLLYATRQLARNEVIGSSQDVKQLHPNETTIFSFEVATIPLNALWIEFGLKLHASLEDRRMETIPIKVDAQVYDGLEYATIPTEGSVVFEKNKEMSSLYSVFKRNVSEVDNVFVHAVIDNRNISRGEVMFSWMSGNYVALSTNFKEIVYAFSAVMALLTLFRMKDIGWMAFMVLFLADSLTCVGVLPISHGEFFLYLGVFLMRSVFLFFHRNLHWLLKLLFLTFLAALSAVEIVWHLGLVSVDGNKVMRFSIVSILVVLLTVIRDSSSLKAFLFLSYCISVCEMYVLEHSFHDNDVKVGLIYGVFHILSLMSSLNSDEMDDPSEESTESGENGEMYEVPYEAVNENPLT